MGHETFLRVGIDGTGAQTGARVVTRSLSDISNQAAQTHNSMQHLRNIFLGFGGAAVGIYGVATAFQKLREALMGVLEYMGRIETETLGIAASFTTGGRFVETLTGKVLQGQNALNAAMNVSRSVIDQLRVANFNTIATLDQLIYAYQVTLPVAMGKGFDKAKVMDFTVAMVQAAGAIGLPFDQIAEETRSMLTGNITRNSRIAQVLGIRPEDVHAIKNDSEALFSFLMGRLEGFKQAGIESQKTWAGLWSNFKDVAQQALSLSFEPMFNEVKRGLKGMIDYMGTVDNEAKKFNWNPEVLENLKELKEGLKDVLAFISGTVSFFNKYGDAILTVVKAYVGYKAAILANTLLQKTMNSELMQTIALQIKLATTVTRTQVKDGYDYKGRMLSPFGQVGTNGGMHGDGSTVISGDVAGMNKFKQAANANAAAAAASAMAAETAAVRELSAAKLAEQKTRLAVNLAEQESIRTSMQSLSSTQAANTATYAKIAAKEREAASEVTSLTMLRASIEAERALIVTKMQALDADAVALALQERTLIAKQANRAATVAETQQLLVQKQALIAKWESELFFEGRSLTQSSGLNLLKQQEINLRRSLSAHTRQAAVEEATLVTIKQKAIATDVAKAQAINALVPLAVQQNGVERQLSAAVATHSALELRAGSALTERGVAAKQLVATEIAQVGIEKELTAATTAATIATANEQKATNAATVAKIRATEANAALTLSSRLAAGAMGILRGALAALGGPVGAIITVLGVAAMAWFTFGNKAEEANKKALTDADSVLKNLDDQIDKLNEINRLKSDTKYTPSIDLKDRSLADSSLGLKNDELRAIATYKAELTALDNKLSKMLNDNIGFELSEEDTKRYKELEGSIQRIIDNRLKLNFVEKEQASPEYVANDKVETDAASKLSALRKFQDAKFALEKANSEFSIAGYREDAARKLSILEDSYDQALTASTEYYRERANIEKESIEQEISANNKLIAELKKGGAEKFSVKEDPTGIKAAAAQLEWAARLVDAKTKGIELTKQLGNVTVETNIAVARSNRDLIDQQEALTISVLQGQGKTKEAAEAQLTTRKAQLEITALETEKTAAAIAGDFQRYALVVSLLNLKNKDIELTRKQIELNEKRKQADPVIALKNATGDSVGALELAQAIEREAEAVSGLSEKATSAAEAMRKLNMEKAKLSQGSELADLQIAGIGDPNARAIAQEQRRHDVFMKNKQLELNAVEKGSKRALEIQAQMNQDTANKDAAVNKLKLDGAAQYTGMAGQLFSALATTQDESSRKGFEAAKAFNIAAVIMNTATAVMAQLSIPGPVGWAGAALAGAMGVINLAKVMSTTFGGAGSIASSPSGGFGAGSSVDGNRGVGGSIGSRITSAYDQQSQESLGRIAGSMENASLAIMKVADGLTKISDLFKEGGFLAMASGAAPGINGETNRVESAGWFKTTTGLNGFSKYTDPLAVFKNIGSGLFGMGNKFQTTGGGFTLGLENGDISSQNYIEQKKAGGWFKKGKTRTLYNEGDAGFEDAMQTALDQIKATVIRAAASTGTTTALNEAKIDQMKIATAGRSSEDIQKDLEAFFTQASNELAKTTVGLKEFAFYGEDAFTALVRLSTSLQGVNELFELTNHTLIAASLEGADAAYRLADAFGGLEEMSDSVNEYFQGMFTDSERAALETAQATRQVQAAFAGIHQTVPKTREEFRTLVDSLDVTTKGGAELYVALMDIAPAFVTMTEAAVTAAQEMRDAFLDSAMSAAQALKDIMGGPLSTLTPREQLMQQQAAFATALATGNNEVLPELGQSLLETAREMFGSGSGYQNEYNNVTTALAAVAGIDGPITMDVVERQIRAITDTQSAIERGTAATVQSIAELRAEIAALRAEQARNTAATVAATQAGADTVADAVVGAVSAGARA